VTQPAWSGRCVVAGESPKHATADDVGAGNGDEEVEDEDEEETDCACVAAGDLLVHCCEGKGNDVGVEDVVEGCDAVELGGLVNFRVEWLLHFGVCDLRWQ